MALHWLILLSGLLLSSALKNEKQDSLTASSSTICEIRKYGVHAIGKCLPDYVMCDNGKSLLDKCHMGYLFDDSDMLCKTPHEEFCSHLIPEDIERNCDAVSAYASEAVQPESLPSKASELYGSPSRASGLYDSSSKASELSDGPYRASELSTNYLVNVGAADSAVKPSKVFEHDSHLKASGLPAELLENVAAADSAVEPSMVFEHDLFAKASGLSADSVVEPSKVFEHDSFVKASGLSAEYMKNAVAADSAVEPSKVFEHDSLVKASGLSAERLKDVGAADSAVEPSMVFSQDSLSKAAPISNHYVKDAVAADSAVKPSKVFGQNSLVKASGLSAERLKDAVATADSSVEASKVFQPDSLSKASGLSAERLKDAGTTADSAVEPSKVFSQDSLSKAAPISNHYVKDAVAADSAVEPSKVFGQDSLIKASGFSAGRLKDAGATADSVEASNVFQPDSLSKASGLSAELLKDAVATADSSVEASKVFQSEQLSRASSLSMNYVKDAGAAAADSSVEASKVFQSDSLSKAAPISNHYVKDAVAADAYVAPSQVFQRNIPLPSRAASLSWNAGSRYYPQAAPVFEPLDKFDGQPSHLLLKNPFAHAEEGSEVNDRFDGESAPQLLKTPFSAGAEESLVKDKFDGDVVPMLLNNPFAHFAEAEGGDDEEKHQYQRNALNLDDLFGNATGNGTAEEDEDLGHYWRRKRSVVDIKLCPVKQRSYRPIFRRANTATTVSHTPKVRTADSSLYPASSLLEIFNNAPDAVTADPECLGRKDGYSYSHGICRSTFHRCINGLKVRHNCAQTTQVFSERSNACVARSEEYDCRPAKPSAISETEMKLNPTGLCEGRMDGLYRHPNSCHRIIQCFGNDTFEQPPCSHGLAFDERRGVCDYRQNVPGCLEPANDASSKPSTFVGCGGYKHGDHIRHKTDCSSFLRCVWDILEVMKCPDGTVFNPKISVCDHPDQVVC